MRLEAGDVGALREAVLTTRPEANALQWTFICSQWGLGSEQQLVAQENVAALVDHADFLSRKGRCEAALSLYERAAELCPAIEAQTWVARGRIHAECGAENYEAALRCYENALDLKPELPEALWRKASVLARQGDRSKAVEDYDALLQVNPRHWRGLIGKAMMLVDMHEYPQATSLAARAVELQREYPFGWIVLARAQTLVGDYKETEQTLDEALECFAENPQQRGRLLRQKAALLGITGRYDEALEAARLSSRLFEDTTVDPEDREATELIRFAASIARTQRPQHMGFGGRLSVPDGGL